MRQDTFIVDAVRTPIGRHGGALAGIRPDDLAAHALSGIIVRAGVDGSRIDDVYLGASNGAGEDNRNVARMAALLAGFPPSVPGTTVNRLCGSGLEAVVSAHRAIAVGDASLVMAGGVESMSRAPWVLQKPDRAYPRGHECLHSTTLGWRMVNPAMPDEWTVALGEGAELLAERYGIDRLRQDDFALRSHALAAQAWADGRLSDEVVPVPDVELDRDEGVREDTTRERLAHLRPVFRPEGSVTAGNSSQLSDGAAVLLLAGGDAVDDLNAEPLARIVASGAHAVEPQWYGIAPVVAAETALRRAGIDWADLSLVELNEAFAAQALACLDEWPELRPEIVNVNGGAIAIGHPIGCSGARIVGTLAHELRRRGGGWGLAAICIGVGQALAMVIESR